MQEGGAFLPLSHGSQAPTFRHSRFGLAEKRDSNIIMIKATGTQTTRRTTDNTNHKDDKFKLMIRSSTVSRQ